MPSRSDPQAAQAGPAETLTRIVERVTYDNEENGFCVLRVKARGQRELITIVGHAASISAGEWVQMSGTWVNDCTHDLQFRVVLEDYTADDGRGDREVSRLRYNPRHWPDLCQEDGQAFGEKVFDIIESASDRLREVDGIGPLRAKRIVGPWAEQKAFHSGRYPRLLYHHRHGTKPDAYSDGAAVGDAHRAIP